MIADTMLAVTNLSVVLEGIQILSDISFTVRQGEAVAVIGPNGAGKTVLFRAILGLLPHTGTVIWRAGTTIGYVPQKFSVDRSAPVTVLDFFLLQSPNFWRPGTEFIRHLDHELALVGLDRGILQKNLGALSGGQMQRLLIAWAMLRHPQMLLLDEPAAGVDAGFQDSLYSLIHRVQTERGTTVLQISHDLSVVYRYAQQVLCLNKSVVCRGSPVEALTPEALASLFGQPGYYRHDPGAVH